MIATGNHLDFDSLRGAPRPYGGERGYGRRAADCRPYGGHPLRPSLLTGAPINQGMIATGNHLDFDSLRGAPLPKGEARGCGVCGAATPTIIAIEYVGRRFAAPRR